MAYLWMVFYLIVLFFELVIKKSKVFSPIVFTNLMWLIIFLGAKFRFYHLYETSDKAFNLVGYGIVLFDIFYLLAEKCVFFIGENKQYKKNYCFNKHAFVIMSIILFLVYVFFVVDAYKIYFAGYGLADIRSYYYGNLDISTTSESNQYYMQVIKTYFLEPFTLTAIVIWSLIARKKIDYVYIAILVALNVFITGGRYIILYALICIWISVVYRNVNISRKVLKKIVTAVVLFILVIKVISALRNSDDDLIKTFYTYFVGDMPYLSILLKSDLWDNCGPLVLINGILQPSLFLLKIFHIISEYPDYFYKMNDILRYLNNGVMIAPNVEYNAFSTFAFLPYISFGYAGVAICCSVLGFFEGSIYRHIKNNLELKNYSILAVLLVIQFKTIQLQPLSNVSLMLSLLYVFLFFKKNSLGEKDLAD